MNEKIARGNGRGAGFVIGAIAVVIAAGGGYWFGGTRKVSQGDRAPSASVALTEPAKNVNTLLYYRNPMGLPDTSPTPKKDPMGMDYIAVFSGEADEEPAVLNQIRISTDKIQKLGVKTEAARLRSLDRIVRVAGRIEPDEGRTYAISPKFEGYVERLHVNVTGQVVGRGQALFEAYSPDLVSAQREYAIAAQGVESLKDAGSEAKNGMKQLADSSLMRLKNWDISEEQVKALATSGDTKRTLTFRSPVSGVVTEKKAVQGMRFMPGEALYQVVDLSTVWVVADVFEQDIGLVKTGVTAKISINAYPDKLFEGKVSYVYPTLNATTRTVPVRVELANPGLLLKPSMFAQIDVPVEARGSVLAIPTSAVIDSGTRQIILIQAKEGRFEPREVKLGARSDTYVEVREGVREGEQVVIAANFLIDAESNLKAAVGGFGDAAQRGGKATSGDALTPVKGVGAHAGHKAEGTVDELDPQAGSVSVRHGPVSSLNWPAMTMEFKVANDALLKNLKPGSAIAFEFVERGPGEWVITSLKPVAKTGRLAPADSHAGH